MKKAVILVSSRNQTLKGMEKLMEKIANTFPEDCTIKYYCIKDSDIEKIDKKLDNINLKNFTLENLSKKRR